MASRHYVITLETGVPKQLSAALQGAVDVGRATIWMQPRSTNTNPVYVGTNDDMTSTDYGVRLPAPVDSVPPAPFNPGEFSGTPERFRSPLKMGDFYVLGTTGDFLHILMVDY